MSIERLIENAKEFVVEDVDVDVEEAKCKGCGQGGGSGPGGNCQGSCRGCRKCGCKGGKCKS